MGHLLNSKVFLEVIGFGHIWDNQATFSKLRTLSAITDKLQNRYFNFWHVCLLNCLYIFFNCSLIDDISLFGLYFNKHYLLTYLLTYTAQNRTMKIWYHVRLIVLKNC